MGMGRRSVAPRNVGSVGGTKRPHIGLGHRRPRIPLRWPTAKGLRYAGATVQPIVGASLRMLIHRASAGSDPQRPPALRRAHS